MPEIKPDLSDESRCISVHWNLPVQCVLPSSHRENWHEAWHPESRNRLRYRRSYGNFCTEELNDGWRDLEIPPPGGFCGLPRSDRPDVRCTEEYGHGWMHRAVVDGVRHTWNTPPPKGLSVDQLTRDVQQLRGMVVDAHARIAELEAAGEHLAFLERATLPELRRDIQHHKDGKQRWRDRAEKAEAERDELRKRVAELEKDSATLAALEAAGVDNWEGYSDAMAGVDE